MDEFLVSSRESQRVDSVKYSTHEYAQHIGGSVPHILACLAAQGFGVHFVGTVGQENAMRKTVTQQLADWGVSSALFERERTCRSVVVIGRDSHLISINSIEESESQLLRVEDISCALIEKLGPSCLVIDARHIAAQIRAASWAKQRSVTVFLDPGSTRTGIFLDKGSPAQSLLSHVDVLSASEEFVHAVGGKPTLYENVSAGPFAGVRCVICGTKSRSCYVRCDRSHFTVTSAYESTRGNTMCVGDTFRGAFLAKFLIVPADARFEPEHVAKAIVWGFAAASWKFQNSDTVPSVPSLEQVTRNHTYMLQNNLVAIAHI